MGATIAKAELLVEHERFKEALDLLTVLLTEDPENRRALYLMSFSLAGLEQWKAALSTGQQLISAAPDWSWAHHQVGQILNQIDKDKQALSHAKEALRLDPEEPDHFALLAACYAGLDNWKRMLHACETGLELDPEHRECILLRAHALRMLKRGDEAGSAIEHLGNLAPNDPSVHISLGWLRLQEGQPTEAMNHFREALRLNPDDPVAREGLAEALKSQNVFYRPILAWYMLSARLGQRGSLALILGMWFGMRFLDKVPGPKWIPITIGVLYFLFVWLSWVGSSLFDLMLYLRRDLREILAKRELRGAQALGISLLLGCILAGVTLAEGAGTDSGFILAAFFLVGIPISGAVGMRNSKARSISALIAAGAFACALIGSAPIVVHSNPIADPTFPFSAHAGDLLIASIFTSLFSTWAIMGLGFVPEGRGNK